MAAALVAGQRSKSDLPFEFKGLKNEGPFDYQKAQQLKADVPFECAWRALAYEYGSALLPGQMSFPSLFDALQLSSLCNQTLSSSADKAAPNKKNFPKSGGASIYVDFQQGADRYIIRYALHQLNALSNPGTVAQPLKTIHAAVLLARTLTPGSTIVLRAGVQWLFDVCPP